MANHDFFKYFFPKFDFFKFSWSKLSPAAFGDAAASLPTAVWCRDVFSAPSLSSLCNNRPFCKDCSPVLRCIAGENFQTTERNFYSNGELTEVCPAAGQQMRNKTSVESTKAETTQCRAGMQSLELPVIFTLRGTGLSIDQGVVNKFRLPARLVLPCVRITVYDVR